MRTSLKCQSNLELSVAVLDQGWQHWSAGMAVFEGEWCRLYFNLHVHYGVASTSVLFYDKAFYRLLLVLEC